MPPMRRAYDTLIARAPRGTALQSALALLEAYPSGLLQRAADYPIRIWLLARGEQVSSAALLDDAARAHRWHGGRVGLADCAGLTVPIARGLLVIAPWDRPAVLHHELGHALGALLSPPQRQDVKRLYCAARAEQRLTVPLAGVTVGEYLACGLAHFAQPHTRPWLVETDPALAALCDALWGLGAQPGPTRLDRLRATLRTAWACARRSLPTLAR